MRIRWLFVEVAEASTGSLNFGGGVSTDGGTTLTLSYQERNFLGRGQFLSLALALSENTTNIDLTFREPWFLDREVSAGWRLFYSDTDQSNDTADITEFGATLDLGYKLSERLSQNWSYTIQQTDISNVTSTEPALVDQAGKSIRSIIGNRLTFTDLDCPLIQQMVSYGRSIPVLQALVGMCAGCQMSFVYRNTAL